MIEFNAQFLSLLAMSCLSLVFAVLLHSKYRLLRSFSSNPRIGSFDKTFNVVGLDSKPRRMLHNVGLLMTLAVAVPFVVWLIVVRTFNIALVLNVIVLILCLGFMMFDATFEICDGANIFIKAFENRANLGRGDIAVLHFLKETIPRLNAYYLSLTIVFLLSFLASPYLASAVTILVSQFVFVASELTKHTGMTGVFIGILPIVVATMVILKTGELIKQKVFNFPSSIAITVLDEQFERILIMGKWGEAPPFELSHRPVLEDYETEERKRRGLMPE